MIILEWTTGPTAARRIGCRLICGVKRHFSTTVMSLASFALLLR
jgi:hypothetical protein